MPLGPRNSSGPLIITGWLARRRTISLSRSLTMSAVSSRFSSTLLYALIEERHFALVDGLRVSNLGSL